MSARLHAVWLLEERLVDGGEWRLREGWFKTRAQATRWWSADYYQGCPFEYRAVRFERSFTKAAHAPEPEGKG